MVRYLARVRLVPALLAACGLVVLAFLSFVLADSVAAYHDARDKAGRRTEDAARVLAEHTARTFEAVEHVLELVRLVVVNHGGSSDTVARRLLELELSSPEIRAIWVLDAEGRLVSASRSALPEAAVSGEHPYFLAHRDGRHVRMYLSEASRTGAGDPFVIASHAVEGEHGSFAGVVALALELRYFERFFADMRNRMVDEVRLVTRSGAILVDVADQTDRPTGMAHTDAFRRAVASSGYGQLGLVEDWSDPRIAAFAVVPGSPLLVLTATRLATMRGELMGHYALHGTLLLGFLAVLALLFLPLHSLMLKPLLSMRAVLDRIRAGQLDEPINAPLAAVEISELFAGVEAMRQGLVAVTSGLNAEVASRTRELAERNIQFAEAIGHMAQGLAMFDAELRLKVCNERYREVFGLDAEVAQAGATLEAILLDCAARGVFAGDSDAVIRERLHVARMPNVDSSILTLADGRVIECWHTATSDGGVLMTYQDISDKVAAERALRESRDQAELANRSKSKFLANMSHELRTPLNAIIGFSEILSREIFGPLGNRRYVEYAGDIHTSGRHLLAIINDLLDIAKIESGKFTLHEQDIDAASVIEEVLPIVAQRVREGNLTLESNASPGLPRLFADARAIKQVLINLLSNAVKFTPAGGRVTVSAQLIDGDLAFLVEDTGIGIAEADIPIALSPFGQVDSTLARQFQGTGLGLPLAKSLIELHGGRLSLTSRLGLGTTVTVRLPSERLRSVRERRRQAV